MKKYVWFALAVVLLVFAAALGSDEVSALELGASPAQLVFEGNVGKLVCTNLSVESNRALRVVFNERWSVRNRAGGWAEQPLLAGKELGLSVALPSSMELERARGRNERWEALFPVCIVGEREGTYAGLLFIVPEKGIAGVGVLMRVRLEGEGREEERTESILRLARAEEAGSERDAEEGGSTDFLLAEEALGLLIVGEALRRAYRARVR